MSSQVQVSHSHPVQFVKTIAENLLNIQGVIGTLHIISHKSSLLTSWELLPPLRGLVSPQTELN